MNMSALALYYRPVVATVAIALAIWGVISLATMKPGTDKPLQFNVFQVPLRDDNQIDPRYAYQRKQLRQISQPIVDAVREMRHIADCEIAAHDASESSLRREVSRRAAAETQVTLLVTLRSDAEVADIVGTIRSRVDELKNLERAIAPDVDMEYVVASNSRPAGEVSTAAQLLIASTITLVFTVYLLLGWQNACVALLALCVVELASIAVFGLFDLGLETSVLVALLFGMCAAVDHLTHLGDGALSHQTRGQNAIQATATASSELSASRMSAAMVGVAGFVPLWFMLGGEAHRLIPGMPTAMVVSALVVWFLTTTWGAVLAAHFVQAPPDPSKPTAPVPKLSTTIKKNIARKQPTSNESSLRGTSNVAVRMAETTIDHKKSIITVLACILLTTCAVYTISIGLQPHLPISELAICWGAVVATVVIVLLYSFRDRSRPILVFLTLPVVLIAATLGLWFQPSALTSQFAVMAILPIVMNMGIHFIVTADRLVAEAKRRSYGTGPIGGISEVKFRRCVVDAIRIRFAPMLCTATVIIAGVLPLTIWGDPVWTRTAWCMILAMVATIILLPPLLATSYSMLGGHLHRQRPETTRT